MRKKTFLAIVGSLLVGICGTNVYADNTDLFYELNPHFDVFSASPYRTAVGLDLSRIINMNPVNIGADTRIYWNDKDITDDKTLLLDKFHEKTTSFQFYNIPYIPNGNKVEPNDGFAISPLNPDTCTWENNDFTTETKVAFLWTVYSTLPPYMTFGVDDNTVKSISISGLPDEALLGLAPNGVLLQFKKAGQYTMQYIVTDSAGNTRTYPTKYTFEIKPFNITDLIMQLFNS